MIQPACTSFASACCSFAGSFDRSAPISVGAYCAAAAWSFASSGTTTSLAGSGAGVGDEQAARARTTIEANAINGFI